MGVRSLSVAWEPDVVGQLATGCHVDVHGSNSTEVQFDCLGLDSPAEAGTPGYDSELRCRENGTIGVVHGVELHEFNVARLPGVVRCAGA